MSTEKQFTEIGFEREGSRLFAVERGAGAPIVLFHGGLATHLACWLYATPLAESFRVITPDLRASGRSHFGGELSWDLLADDVAALLDHLGIERAVVGGSSFGAGLGVRARWCGRTTRPASRRRRASWPRARSRSSVRASWVRDVDPAGYAAAIAELTRSSSW